MKNKWQALVLMSMAIYVWPPSLFVQCRKPNMRLIGAESGRVYRVRPMLAVAVEIL